MDLKERFFNVSNEVRRLQFMSPGSSSNDQYQTLILALQRLEKEISQTPHHTIEIFASIHYEEIVRIVRTIRTITNPLVRSLHDRIFTNFLKIQKRIPTPLTLIFQEFIKGVTYFQHQSGIETPIYHRLDACGPGDTAFRETFQRCSDDMEEDRQRDIKRRIETCYIERLIYNSIYCNFAFHFPQKGDEIISQDEGHLNRLQITKEDFETCFPHLEIDVKVTWDLQLPVQLTVIRKLHGKVTSTEVYKKEIMINELFGSKVYSPYISCLRITDHKQYYRTQRFDYLPKWKEIDVSLEAEKTTT